MKTHKYSLNKKVAITILATFLNYLFKIHFKASRLKPLLSLEKQWSKIENFPYKTNLFLQQTANKIFLWREVRAKLRSSACQLFKFHKLNAFKVSAEETGKQRPYPANANRKLFERLFIRTNIPVKFPLFMAKHNVFSKHDN